VTGFLLDTNVLSELTKARPTPKVVSWIEAQDEDRLFLSVLTLGEIRKEIAMFSDTARRSAIASWLDTALRRRFAGRILPVDEAVADCWGAITAAAVKTGAPVPAIDGLLAATALQHGLTLVTRNTADVAGTGVPFFNPWT